MTCRFSEAHPQLLLLFSEGWRARLSPWDTFEDGVSEGCEAADATYPFLLFSPQIRLHLHLQRKHGS